MNRTVDIKMSEANDLEAFRKQWVTELKQSNCETSDNKADIEDGKDRDPVINTVDTNISSLKKYPSTSQTLSSPGTSAVSHHRNRNSPSQEHVEKRTLKRKAISDFWRNLTSQGEEDNNDASESKKQRVDPTVGEGESSKADQKEKYLDLFLSDLNEINEIPFFDLEIPREIAVKIFRFLSATDLCRCAQVSKAWRSMAEDELLWCDICHREGYELTAVTSDKQDWKHIVRSQTVQHKSLQHNWKNRIGKLTSLNHVPGGILCAVTSHQQLVVAGYSSREVKVWDTDTGESCILRPSDHVTQVQLGNQAGTHTYSQRELVCNQAYTAALFTKRDPLACAIDIWCNHSSTRAQATLCQHGEVRNMRLTEHSNHIITTKASALLLHSIDLIDGDGGVSSGESDTMTCSLVEDVTVFPDEKITHLAVIPRATIARSAMDHLIVAASGSKVKVHIPGSDPENMSCLHNVFLQNVQHLECTNDECIIAIHDFNPGLNCNMYMMGVYSLDSARQTSRFSSGSSVLSCVHKNPDVPHLIAAGTYNAGIKLFDVRSSGADVIRLRDGGHSSTCIQMDEWKVVSGSQQGFVSVWDYRMPVKCWDMHNRCPVQYTKFYNNSLITANIPVNRVEPAWDCDQDGMTNSRYRGSVNVYDFRQTQDTTLLPTICHSDYDMPEQYSYNIRLAMPYDRLSSS